MQKINNPKNVHVTCLWKSFFLQPFYESTIHAFYSIQKMKYLQSSKQNWLRNSHEVSNEHNEYFTDNFKTTTQWNWKTGSKYYCITVVNKVLIWF